MQNLVDNARQFENESLRSGENTYLQSQKDIDWRNEKKTKLVKIDDEEQSKGRGFMKRVKERRDLQFPKKSSVSIHKLINNASRFQKEPRIRNLILVRNRNKLNQ